MGEVPRLLRFLQRLRVNRNAVFRRVVVAGVALTLK